MESELFRGMGYVYAVYREGSFSAAAEKLFISQPSLSANVKHVEKQIGFPIFDRSTKPVTLTEGGKKYIESVRKIMVVEEEFRDFMSDWNDLKTGSLILGGSNLFSSWILPPMIAGFTKLHPGISVELIEESTSGLTAMIQKGDIDIMLDNAVLGEDLYDSRIYREEHMLLAVPVSMAQGKELEKYRISVSRLKDGSWQNIPPVPMNAFAEMPFIMLKPENNTRLMADAIFAKAGIHPPILLELDQQTTAYNVACSGMGISFIGDLLATRVPESDSVVYFRTDPSVSGRYLCFYWKSGRYLTKAMQAFLSECTL